MKQLGLGLQVQFQNLFSLFPMSYEQWFSRSVVVLLVQILIYNLNYLCLRPPVSLASALGLASAAAHAHYVNGMVSAGGGGRIISEGHAHHHPAAALHAAVAAAAAAAAQRAEAVREEESERDRGSLYHEFILFLQI